MTNPAKIAADRQNALLSTGPRTPAGKLVVAQNAVRHGVFAHLPVVPGESEADWHAHQQGRLASLAPVGLLELTLAERVAHLFWRLARYPGATTAAAVEDAGPLPPGGDPIPHPHLHHNSECQLKLAEQELRRQRESFFAVTAVADFLRHALAAGDDGDPLPAKPVRAVLGEAYTLALDCPIRHDQPLWHTDRPFLDRIGVPPNRPADESWPRDRFLAALDHYASATEWPPEEFRGELQRTLDGRADGFARGIRRREAEVAALTRRLDDGQKRRASAAFLPPAEAAEQVMRYEKHLHSQLTSTLNELERLQARRGGTLIPPGGGRPVHNR